MPNFQSRFVSVGMFALLLVLVFQLRDRDIEFVLEPDFSSSMITIWRLFFETGALAHLPVPAPHPYLDGQFIVYAIASGVLRAITYIIPQLGTLFPNEDAYNLAAANLVNGLAFATASYLFFRTISALTGSIPLGVLAALLLVLSPSMIQIGFIRCDYLAMSPIVALFCGGMQIARGRETAFASAALGVALAFIATIKINGCFFALFLMIGVLTRHFARPTLPRIRLAHVAIFAISLAVALTIFMFRFWIHMDVAQIAKTFWLSIEVVRQWTRLPNTGESYYYYHTTLLEPHGGQFFIALYMATSVIVFWQAATTREGHVLYLTISLVVFSAIAALTYKYSRGGYHLLPIFIANIAVATAFLWQMGSKFGRCMSIVAVLAASATLWMQTIYFLEIAQAASQRSTVIDLTRRAPRLWLKKNISEGSVICLQKHSEWALPPLSDLPFRVIEGPFNYPYLDVTAMKAFSPPTVSEVAKTCSIVMLSDFHEFLYDYKMAQYAPDQVIKWRAFFSKLRHDHPPHVFESNVTAFSVKRVDIFDMRQVGSK